MVKNHTPINFSYLKSKFINNLFSIVYLGTLVLLLADSYRSDDSVSRYIGISSRSVCIYAIVFLTAFRVIYAKRLSPALSKLNTFLIFPIIILICIALTIYDYNMPTNAAYALIPIQYIQLCVVSIFSLVVIALQFSNSWYKKYYHFLIFIGFFVVLGYAYLSTFFPWDIFYNISKEDFFIENLQFYVLAISSIFAFLVAKKLFAKQKIHFLIFLLVSLGLLAIAGDEISWGQRILNLSTPEIIASNSDQKEITIHNLSSFAGYVGIGYILVGLYGAFAWIAQIFIPNLRNAPFFYYIPEWCCMGYFFFGFLFNYYNRVTKHHPFAVWSEFAELMLYVGVMLALLGVFIKIKKSKSSAKNRT